MNKIYKELFFKFILIIIKHFKNYKKNWKLKYNKQIQKKQTNV